MKTENETKAQTSQNKQPVQRSPKQSPKQPKGHHKGSHRAILGLAAFLLVTITALIISARILVATSCEEFQTEQQSYPARSYPAHEFDTIVVEGASEVKIRQGTEWQVTYFSRDSSSPTRSISQQGKSLVIGQHTGKQLDCQNKRRYIEPDLVEITMPYLAAIHGEGFAKVEFRGFHSDELIVNLEGVGKIIGLDSEVQRLTVTLKGMGKIDLSESIVKNANVQLEGMGKIWLNMNGGVLSGTLEGMGNIKYRGKVADEQVVVDGLGKVSFVP